MVRTLEDDFEELAELRIAAKDALAYFDKYLPYQNDDTDRISRQLKKAISLGPKPARPDIRLKENRNG